MDLFEVMQSWEWSVASVSQNLSVSQISLEIDGIWNSGH
jgi:hypothetical protein